MYQAAAYAGVVDLLDVLPGRFQLGTATARRTDTAEAILDAHGLADYFAVIAGTEAGRTTKAETIARTCARLGDPDPATLARLLSG